MVKNSAFRFSYDSAFQIWPSGPVRYTMQAINRKMNNPFSIEVMSSHIPTLNRGPSQRMFVVALEKGKGKTNGVYL